MSIQGIHHITLICTLMQRTINFYTQVLGLRLVKQTVNFDSPSSYHLYFGDEVGSVGSLITLFEWAGARRGATGIGGTHHFALEVADVDGLLKWKRRLSDFNFSVEGPLERHYFTSIYFRDPDGAMIEIATHKGAAEKPDKSSAEEQESSTEDRESAPEMVLNNRDEKAIEDETWPEPVPQITNDMALKHELHHITAITADIERTDAFFGELLGMQRLKMTSSFDDPNAAHWYWGIGNGQPGTLITYFERNPEHARRARIGAGQAHHFALAVPDEPTLLEWREKLLKARLRVSPVIDRLYFKSIYTQDPDGHTIELATIGPGFTVDEEINSLGTTLKLPPWLEAKRSKIESGLRAIRV